MPKLFENLWVKIAALLLAILLWFHVATDKIYQNTLSLPLVTIEIPEELVLTERPPDSITVIVSAKGKTLLRTDWKKNGLKLVANRSRPGKFIAEISPDVLSLVKAEKVDLIDVVTPREITLTCDRKTRKEVMVLSQLAALPDEGYAIDDKDSIAPATVEITGPMSLMTSISHIKTEKLVVEGIRNSFSKTIALVPPDAYGFSIAPDSVDVFVKVVPVKRKAFSDITIDLINAPSREILTLLPDKIEIKVSGKAEAIDTLTENQISAIADYVLIDSQFSIPVQVILPPSITLLQKSVDSVKVVWPR